MDGDEMSNKQQTPGCNMHEALVSYLYHEASPQEIAEVEAHLEICAVCKDELHSFERVRGMLQQWQLDDLPIVRVVAQPNSENRSILAVLKELFSMTPIWGKAIGAMAMAMFVLAILGTDINVGKGGVSVHADLLRRDRGAAPSSPTIIETSSGANIEQVRTEVKGLVAQLIAESERQHKDETRTQLVSLESQIQNMRSADLAKLATRIQEQHARLKTIEQDIDRREGLDLTDILFSEVSRPANRSTTGGD